MVHKNNKNKLKRIQSTSDSKHPELSELFSILKFEESYTSGETSSSWINSENHYRLTAKMTKTNKQEVGRNLTLVFGCPKNSIRSELGEGWREIMQQRLAAARQAIQRLIYLHRFCSQARSCDIPGIYAKLMKLRRQIADSLSGDQSGKILSHDLNCRPILLDSLLVDSPLWIETLNSTYQNVYFQIEFNGCPGEQCENPHPIPRLSLPASPTAKFGPYLKKYKVEYANDSALRHKITTTLQQGNIELCLYFEFRKGFAKTIQRYNAGWERQTLYNLLSLHQESLSSVARQDTWKEINRLVDAVDTQARNQPFSMVSEYRDHNLPEKLVEKTLSKITNRMMYAILSKRSYETLLEYNEIRNDQNQQFFQGDDGKGCLFFDCSQVSEDFSIHHRLVFPILSYTEDGGL